MARYAEAWICRSLHNLASLGKAHITYAIAIPSTSQQDIPTAKVPLSLPAFGFLAPAPASSCATASVLKTSPSENGPSRKALHPVPMTAINIDSPRIHQGAKSCCAQRVRGGLRGAWWSGRGRRRCCRSRPGSTRCTRGGAAAPTARAPHSAHSPPAGPGTQSWRTTDTRGPRQGQRI